MPTERLLRIFKWLLKADTIRIDNPAGRQYLIIGCRSRNQYPSFQERTVASGLTQEELIEAVFAYHRLGNLRSLVAT